MATFDDSATHPPSDKIMMKLTASIAIFFITVASCFGQDTVKVEKSIYYTSNKEPIRGKAFASKAKYARENIVFSNTHKRIEYCYYYDNERHCYGTNYQLTSDTTVAIDDEIWNYKKQGDQYFMERYFNGTYESGIATSLIPFEIAGPFTTTTADKMDTLWTTDYSKDKPSQPYDKPLWTFHKTRLTGKIYTPDKIDEPPTLLNGDSLGTIYLGRADGCLSEPYYFVKEITFIVTKEGRIVNIEQAFGNIDLDFCPYYVMDLMRYLLQLKQIKPARVKGQEVAVQWTLKVEMHDKPGQK